MYDQITDHYRYLDLGLHILNGVRWLHLQSDGFPSESLDKDLHSSTKPQDQVQGRLLLDVVVGQGAPVFQLLPSENETLLIWGDALLVLKKRLCERIHFIRINLDLGLHIFDGVGGLHFKSDGLASQGFDKDLHIKHC